MEEEKEYRECILSNDPRDIPSLEEKSFFTYKWESHIYAYLHDSTIQGEKYGNTIVFKRVSNQDEKNIILTTYSFPYEIDFSYFPKVELNYQHNYIWLKFNFTRKNMKPQEVYIKFSIINSYLNNEVIDFIYEKKFTFEDIEYEFSLKHNKFIEKRDKVSSFTFKYDNIKHILSINTSIHSFKLNLYEYHPFIFGSIDRKYKARNWRVFEFEKYLILTTTKLSNDTDGEGLGADFKHLTYRALKIKNYCGIDRDIFFICKKTFKVMKHIVTYEGFPRNIIEVKENVFCFNFGHTNLILPTSLEFEKEASNIHTIYLISI